MLYVQYLKVYSLSSFNGDTWANSFMRLDILYIRDIIVHKFELFWVCDPLKLTQCSIQIKLNDMNKQYTHSLKLSLVKVYSR